MQRNFNPPGVVWFPDFKPKKVHNSENCVFLFVFLNCYQNKPNRQRLSLSTGAFLGMVIHAIIIPLLADFYKPKRADLLRQFFNFGANSGNLAKIIKRRFRDKLRAYDAPVVVLVYHIAIFALKITWFRNKSIFHSISPLYYFIIAINGKSPPQESNPRKPKQVHQTRQKGRIYRPEFQPK